MGRVTRNLLSGTAAIAVLAYGAGAARAAKTSLDMPSQPLDVALNTVGLETKSEVLFSKDLVAGYRAPALKGAYEPQDAIDALLKGTGLQAQRTASNVYVIAPPGRAGAAGVRVAAAAKKPAAATETVVVTAQKKNEDIQTVPIAVSAFTQKQLTERQVAGGPDLVKEVPNLTFSKTNFTGYNLEIRGIGTQAISVTTDPAVAVAFNGIPFIRNHFFEQEFYDLDNLEVLRGPQGTLYGRNATAGVVNVISAKPSDSYEAIASVDIGNYSSKRLEGMVNLPIVDDKLAIRAAGEWTIRKGYSFNEVTDQHIDGRDLWSARVTLAFKPTKDFQAYLVWEHFSEDDDRMRTSKQLCKTAQPPASIDGVPVPPGGGVGVVTLNAGYLSQGCELTSLYSPDAFQVPYGFSLPFVVAGDVAGFLNANVDPYASTTQSRNLRSIESALNPNYKAKNDTIELNADYRLTPALTLSSQTGYNQDSLWSTEDYNRFNTSPGIFGGGGTSTLTDATHPCSLGGPPCFKPDPQISGAFILCDPQLGCSDRLVAQDLSNEHAWQLSQELRLASSFAGPFNFSVGGNVLHYETEENYYVFINALTAFAALTGDRGTAAPSNPPGSNSNCLQIGVTNNWGFQRTNPVVGGGEPTQNCIYIDTNPISSLNNYGHNYFLSQNPYLLNSYAVFGEAYYDITNELKLTGGLRWTEDRKHFADIPSEVVTGGYGYFTTRFVDQQWDEFTGRAVLNWTPKLDFTDQTLIYGSFARGYKAGGANPPGAVFSTIAQGNSEEIQQPVHPLTFRPEFINAFELGTKNTLLDGALTINADVFYYAYKDYQISEIVDRTSVNQNFNAIVRGAEVESTWEPAPGLRFSVAGGYENATLNKGDSAVDLMDRTAGMPGWLVMKPFPTAASNCILPDYVVAALLQQQRQLGLEAGSYIFACEQAYFNHVDPVTLFPYVPNPTLTNNQFGNDQASQTFSVPAGYPGFDPTNPAINNGEGFAKNLAGNKLPNAPPFTLSFTAEYTVPVWTDWAATLHGDFYWQGNSFARVFNDKPYDQIHGYSNVNLSLILNSADGWQVMGYVKNVFNKTAITGDFLNSDDSGLTTNVFLTDPRLFGIRVTKDFNEGQPGSYGIPEYLRDIFSPSDNGKPTLWIELGGQAENITGQGDPFVPPFLAVNSASVVLHSPTPVQAQRPAFGFGEEGKVTFQPSDSDWIFTAAARIGRSSNFRHVDHQITSKPIFYVYQSGVPPASQIPQYIAKFADTQVHRRESHAIMDFAAGKNVGLGVFGEDLASTLSFGVRYAQFNAKETFDIRARPSVEFKYYPSAAAPFHLKIPHFHGYHATGEAARRFDGVGPAMSWTGTAPVLGDLQQGEATFDWGANAALLFGRQKARAQHMESGYYRIINVYTTLYHHSGGHNGNHTVIVPNLGGFAGVSYRIKNAKISLGYRADFFLGALDGGIDARKSTTVGFMGPYATIGVGLGG